MSVQFVPSPNPQLQGSRVCYPYCRLAKWPHATAVVRPALARGTRAIRRWPKAGLRSPGLRPWADLFRLFRYVSIARKHRSPANSTDYAEFHRVLFRKKIYLEPGALADGPPAPPSTLTCSRSNSSASIPPHPEPRPSVEDGSVPGTAADIRTRAIPPAPPTRSRRGTTSWRRISTTGGWSTTKPAQRLSTRSCPPRGT